MAERVPLLDDDGRTVATYLAGERFGRPCADRLDRAPGVPAARVVATILARLGGWVVAGAEADVADALIAAGAQERRRAVVMRHDLATLPRRESHAHRPPRTDKLQAIALSVPAGITIVPLAHGARELLPVFLAAFPPGHVDRAPGSSDADELADLERVFSGEEVGPLTSHSRVALGAGGGAVGAAIVTASASPPPFGGPWLAEVCRHPRAAPAGTGAALIGAAIASLRRAGERSLGLAVSVGNPAQGVYERLGFRAVTSGVTVVVPPVDSITGV